MHSAERRQRTVGEDCKHLARCRDNERTCQTPFDGSEYDSNTVRPSKNDMPPQNAVTH